MESDSSIHELMARLQARDAAAAEQVFQRYAERLIELAQKNLRPLVRSKMDPEDVMQSALKSFFVRQRAGEFMNVENWESLWKVLVTLTLRKCGHRTAHYYAKRRDVHREVAAELLEVPPEDAGDADSDWESQVPDPTTEEAAQLAEMIESLMARLGKDDERGARNRQILALRLQGHQYWEIADKIGCTSRTVSRVLERVGELLRRMQAEEQR